MPAAYFQIRNSKKRRAKPCAFMSFSDNGELAIEIERTVSPEDMPAYFSPFAEKGVFNLDSSQALRWVRERIPPSGRQNIGEILKAHGLSEYSELELLRSGHGESAQDDFVVEEITRAEFEQRKILKSEGRREALGRRIATRRRGLSLSQKELADEVGIGQPSLSRIEKGSSNVTFDLLADLDECTSRGNRQIINTTGQDLWNQDRWAFLDLLKGDFPDLACLYQRIVDELECYSEKNEAALVDSRIISHCFREFMNTFPEYIDDTPSLKSNQGKETAAIDKLKRLVDETTFSANDGSFLTPIPARVVEALASLKEARKDGSDSNATRMNIAVSCASDKRPPSAAWKESRELAVNTAHLPRGNRKFIPSLEDYLQALQVLENTVLGRKGNVFDAKIVLKEAVERANRMNGEGKHDAPSHSDVMEFISLVGDHQLRKYAFSTLKNPLWLDALDEAGFFGVYENGESSESLIAPFEPFPYFVTCAKESPESAFRALKKLSTSKDYEIRSLLLTVTPAFPDDIQIGALDLLNKWANDSYGLNTHFWNAKLLEKLLEASLDSANERVRKSGKRLFQNLTIPRFGETEASSRNGKTLIQDYSYPRLVKKLSKLLNTSERVSVSRRMLNSYISGKSPDKEHPINSRMIAWSLDDGQAREEIESHHPVIAWVTVLERAIVEMLASHSEAKPIDLDRQSPFVRRVVMHAIHRFVDEDSPTATHDEAKSIIQKFVMSEYAFENEYEMEMIPILRDYSKSATPADLDCFFASLQGRLDEWQSEALKRYSSWSEDDKKNAEIARQSRNRLEHSILACFDREQLPPSLQDISDSLNEEFGKYTGPHPLFHVQTMWGPNSPVALEELLATNPRDVISLLNEWEPTETERFNLIELQGLSRELARLVHSDPFFFAGLTKELSRAKPVYLAGAVDGWKDALGDRSDIPVRDALHVCKAIASLNASEKGTHDASEANDPEDAKRHAAWFLSGLLEPRNSKLSAEEMSLSFEILQLLIGCRPCEEEADEGEYDHLDPLQASLNILSSISIKALAEWLANSAPKNDEDKQSARKILEAFFPDVWHSASDVAALSTSVPYLLQHEEEWLASNYSRLYGGENPNEMQRLMLACQIQFFTMSPTVFEFLAPAIEVSLEQGLDLYPTVFNGQPNCFNESIGFWLYQLVAIGEIPLDDPFVHKWQNGVTAEVRGNVLENICRNIEADGTTEAIATNVGRLWDHNAETFATESGSLKGCIHLARTHFYTDAWLRKSLLQEAFNHDMSDEIWLWDDAILRLASGNPAWGISLLRSVIEASASSGTEDAYKYSSWASELLLSYISSGGPRNDKDFLFCLDKLGRMGFTNLDERLGLVK